MPLSFICLEGRYFSPLELTFMYKIRASFLSTGMSTISRMYWIRKLQNSFHLFTSSPLWKKEWLSAWKDGRAQQAVKQANAEVELGIRKQADVYLLPLPFSPVVSTTGRAPPAWGSPAALPTGCKGKPDSAHPPNSAARWVLPTVACVYVSNWLKHSRKEEHDYQHPISIMVSIGYTLCVIMYTCAVCVWYKCVLFLRIWIASRFLSVAGRRFDFL